VNATGPLVYLVDDDAAALRAFARLLQAWGYRVRTFASAQEFLEAFEEDTAVPDCLLLDVHMPGLSGVELQAHLRRGDQSLPVVFLSGHLDAALRTGALSAGAVDFLQKPIDAEDLLRAVERAVAQRRNGVRPAPSPS
jgi:FixJ family two-component response regulator